MTDTATLPPVAAPDRAAVLDARDWDALLGACRTVVKVLEEDREHVAADPARLARVSELDDAIGLLTGYAAWADCRR